MSAAVEQHAGHGHGGHSGAEPDNPKILIVGGAVVFFILLFVAICVGVVEFYSFTVRDHISEVELQPQNSLLKELRAKEAGYLSEYQYVDQAKGVVRIPIDRAVALTLRDWDKRPGGVKAPAGTPAPAPTSGSTTAPSSAPAPEAPKK